MPLLYEIGPKVQIIKDILRRPAGHIRRTPKILLDTLYDWKRFISHSGAIHGDYDKCQLQSVILRQAHNIEKGLSLPAPRLLFGQANLRELVRNTRTYLEKHGQDWVTDISLAVVQSYIDFNINNGAEDGFLDFLADFLARHQAVKPDHGGLIELAAHPEGQMSDTLVRFLLGRSSVRNFQERRVEDKVLEIAASCAAKAPAVCNRQFGRILHSSDTALIQKLLTVQGGARGFLDSVPTLVAVTVDLSAYTGEERYQGWIDGGLFAMNFIHGLQAQGVSSCCLNWSKGRAKDREMRGHLKISDSENIIMFIACGYAKDGAKVARSSRAPLSYILNEM